MTAYKITAELNLEKIIGESREVAQAWNEFIDDLEQIEKKYIKPQETVTEFADKGAETTDENLLQTMFKLEAENERLHDAFTKIVAEIEAEKIEGWASRNGSLELAISIINKYRKETEQCRTKTITNP